RPAHGEHDARGDDPGLPGSRRGARRHGARRSRRGASTPRAARGGGDRLRRRRADAREGGCAKVLRLVRRAPRRRARQVRGRDRIAVNRERLIEGIWERDATTWTGSDEGKWLCWRAKR